MLEELEALKEYFDITETGIEPVGDDTPIPAIEALGYALRLLSRDQMRWWVGDWAIIANSKGPGTYEILAEKIWDGHYEGSSIETIAYVCRNVPGEVRRKELSFWFHKVVAPLNGDPEKQAEYLEVAVNQGLSHSAFSKLVSGKSSDEPAPTSREDDRIFELQMEIEETRKKLMGEIEKQMERADSAEMQLTAYKTKIEKLHEDVTTVLEYLEEVNAPAAVLEAQLEVKRGLDSL